MPPQALYVIEGPAFPGSAVKGHFTRNPVDNCIIKSYLYIDPDKLLNYYQIQLLQRLAYHHRV
jgi:hypothetical protein